MPQKMKHQYCFLLIIFVIVMLIMYMRFDYGTKNPFIEDVKDSSKTENNKSVFTKMEDIKQPSENIFFLETRCTTNKSAQDFEKSGDGVLTARQGCAIESTARTNPGRNIYVFLSCFPGDGDSPLLQKLTALPSVKLVFLHPRAVLLHTSAQGVEELLEKSIYPVEHSSDLFRLALLWKYGGTYFDLDVINIRYNRKEVFEGSPVEQLVTKGGTENSSFPVEHSSDILRVTLLWRYGGVYCDTDVVTIRSLADLGTNFCGMESTTTIGNAILAFEPAGFGHELLTNILMHINDHFDGSQWTVNGPDVITNFVLKVCNATIDTASYCTEFSVFNHSLLYPVFWWDAEDLFSADLGPDLVTCISRTAYLVHIWNKLTSKATIQVGSDQAYGLLANRFCPDVYGNCGDTF